MSRHPTSYARVVDAMPTTKAKKKKTAPTKGPKSPDSSRPDFNQVKRHAPPVTSKTQAKAFAPSAHPEPRPHGMGERGVTRKAYYMSLRKARKAVRKSHHVKYDFNHEKTGPSRER